MTADNTLIDSKEFEQKNKSKKKQKNQNKFYTNQQKTQEKGKQLNGAHI